MKKTRRLELLSVGVIAATMVSACVVNADIPYIRRDAEVKYKSSFILTYNVENKYFVSTTPYTISDSNGIYMANSTSYKTSGSNLYLKNKNWNMLMKEEKHRNWNDQTLPNNYASASLKSVNENKTTDSTITAKFGINDPWDA